jgi:hypothetical protein
MPGNDVTIRVPLARMAERRSPVIRASLVCHVDVHVGRFA